MAVWGGTWYGYMYVSMGVVGARCGSPLLQGLHTACLQLLHLQWGSSVLDSMRKQGEGLPPLLAECGDLRSKEQRRQ